VTAEQDDDARGAVEAAQTALREGIRRAQALVDDAKLKIGDGPGAPETAPETEPEPVPPNPAS
jgi:hypothetical protein